MIVFKVRDKEYKFPESLEEITLGQWVEYAKTILQQKPESLDGYEKQKTEKRRKEYLKDIDLDEITGAWVEYYLKVIAYWSDLPINEAIHLDREDMSLLYKLINELSGRFKYNENLREFKHKDNTYYFPPAPKNAFIEGKDYMRGNRVIDMIESLQMDKYAEIFGSKEWGALPYLIAILCKQKDEYLPLDGADREAWIVDRAKVFEDLSLSVCLNLAFFLTIQSVDLEPYLNLSLLTRELRELRNQRQFGRYTVGT